MPQQVVQSKMLHTNCKCRTSGRKGLSSDIHEQTDVTSLYYGDSYVCFIAIGNRSDTLTTGLWERPQ